jgi:hypothetical protein
MAATYPSSGYGGPGVTERCPDCEWITLRTFGDWDSYVLGRPCRVHKPPPTPIEEARAELDEIDHGA